MTTDSARRLTVALSAAGAVMLAAAVVSVACTRWSAAVAPVQASTWVYQLQNYPGGRLDHLMRGPHEYVVIDLARDAKADFFTAAEIGQLRSAGRTVLAYFEIGSIERFRPEYRLLLDEGPDLVLNVWQDWPQENFVAYWEPSWWQLVVRPRIDQAIAAGFDGIYLDTPLAYEEIDLSLVPGLTRHQLAAAMTDLIVRISSYAKEQRAGILVVPQNSPELREYPGYVNAIDGIGMEELFVRATNEPCSEDYCEANLVHTRALRQAGKLVLAVDYATDAEQVAAACAGYRAEGFIGYVTTRPLDGVSPPCK